MDENTWDSIIASFEKALRKRRVAPKQRALHLDEAKKFVGFITEAMSVAPIDLSTRHLDCYQGHLQAQVDLSIEILVAFVAHVADHLGGRI